LGPLGFAIFIMSVVITNYAANLSNRYEHASGREAALEMLHTLIMKFPETVVEEHAESIFLPLVARLVNDNANHVRAMVGTVLKVLMSRVGPRALQRMIEFSLTWYKGDNSRLWRPAAQVRNLYLHSSPCFDNALINYFAGYFCSANF
jgi:hypothetical protein